MLEIFLLFRKVIMIIGISNLFVSFLFMIVSGRKGEVCLKIEMNFTRIIQNIF